MLQNNESEEHQRIYITVVFVISSTTLKKDNIKKWKGRKYSETEKYPRNLTKNYQFQAFQRAKISLKAEDSLPEDYSSEVNFNICSLVNRFF